MDIDITAPTGTVNCMAQVTVTVHPLDGSVIEVKAKIFNPGAADDYPTGYTTLAKQGNGDFQGLVTAPAGSGAKVTRAHCKKSVDGTTDSENFTCS